MTQFNPAFGSLKMIGMPARQAQASAPAAQEGAPNPDSSFSFHDLVSIVNPLQHLPVIGTLYRAITHDTIGTLEKIAGDTLYGGLWGAVTSVADAAFEAVTGKDVGETMLALFTGDDAAAEKVAAATPGKPAALPPDANLAALTAALAQKGFDGDIARRAVFAYQKSQDMTNTTVLAAAQ